MLCVQANEIRNSFTTSHWQADVDTLSGKRASSHIMVAWEDKCRNSERPHFLCPYSAFIAEHNILWYRTSLWSAAVSWPGCFPSQLLVHPQSTCWRGSVRSRKGLDGV